MNSPLAQSEECYRRLFEAARDGILLLDRDTGRITDANPFMYELLGYPPDTLLGKELWEIGLFKDEEASKAAFQHLHDDGYIRYEDLPLQTRLGEPREVEVVSNVYAEGSKNVIQCNIRDISERRRAEFQVRERENQLRTITDNVPLLIARVDTDYRYQFANAAYQNWLEIPTDHVVGHTITEVMGETVFAVIRPYVDRVIAGERVRFDTQIDYRTIGPRHMHVSYIPEFGQDGAVIGFVLSAMDVTERMLLQKQVVQTEKLAALGELVAGVAHEINNPLAAISGYAQLLKKYADVSVREDAAIIVEMVTRAARIVRSLRLYARPSDDSRILCQLNDVVTSALDIIAHKLRNADIVMEMDLSDDMPMLLMNAGEMEQVIVNLLSNAEHALRSVPIDRRIIRLTTRLHRRGGSGNGILRGTPARSQDVCTLEVRDFGAGMAESVRERIFDPFFSTKETGEGTGLGLYISHGIVTGHGGTIKVQSRIGEGTTFTITLPVESDGIAAIIHVSETDLP